jgi:hypothetical protein
VVIFYIFTLCAASQLIESANFKQILKGFAKGMEDLEF